MSEETFVSDEQVRRLGASGLLAVRLTDYAIRAEQVGYARGYLEGIAADEKTLVGHCQIAKYLCCSKRQSQKIVADLRKRGLAETKRGRQVRISKELLKDYE